MNAQSTASPALVREVQIEYKEYPFRLRFYSDGTGNATELYGNQAAEEVADAEFEWTPDDAESLETVEDWRRFGSDIFRESVADNLEDPFLSPEDTDQETYFRIGSEEDLQHMLELIVASLPEAFDHFGEDALTVRVTSETEDGGATVELGDQLEMPQPVFELFQLALEQNVPVGWSWEYNDGAYDRRSGYTQFSNNLEFEIQRPSFHQVAMSPTLLARKLEKHITGGDLAAMIEAARTALKPGDSMMPQRNCWHG